MSWFRPKKPDEEENRRKPSKSELKEIEKPQFYPIHQNTEGVSPYPLIRKKVKSALKEVVSEEVGDVPQYHDPEIEKPWFRKIIKECQPHVHNYRMCLVDEIDRDYTPEEEAREENCKVLAWNLINCASRLLCGKELQNTGWDCYKNDPVSPTEACVKSESALNTCLSLNKIIHLPNMIPAHITPDSWLWKDFDKRWDWIKETGWGDWLQVLEKANREHPPFHIREYFRRLQLDRERRLVWINKRRQKYGHPLFTMQDLINHEKDLDVYESIDHVPKDLLEPRIYP